MPLLNHFAPPISRTHSWRSIHGAWAAAMSRLLNHGILPDGYYALPFVDHDGPVEIDVATFRETNGRPIADESVWSPAEPTLAVAIEPHTVNAARVEVMTDDGDPRLVAAIELASPRNKDRGTARRTFGTKCAGYLMQGAGLVMVDAVTTRQGDLHAAILAALGATGVGIGGPSAVAYRAVAVSGETILQAWPSPLVTGQPLPTMPLWLAGDLVVPLDLEASYTAACDDLRVRPAGLS